MGGHKAACPGWGPEGSPCSLLWTRAKLTLEVSGLFSQRRPSVGSEFVNVWWVNEKSQGREGGQAGSGNCWP